MTRRLSIVVLLVVLATVGWAQAPAAPTNVVVNAAVATACNQTLSGGANIATAVAAVANGTPWVICLNTATYSGAQVNFANITRTSGMVTIKEGAGQTVTIADPQFSNADFITLGPGFTMSGTDILACSTNITITGNSWSATSGIGISNYNSVCSNYPANIIIEHNTLAGVSPVIGEGSIDVRDQTANLGTNWNVIIRYNSISSGAGDCNADGVQLTGDVQGLTIGPGNIFTINQVGATHCDHIQFYGGGSNNVIDSNWFNGTGIVLTHHSSTPTGTRWTNNIMQNTAGGYQAGATSTNFVFDHNTVCNNDSSLQVTNMASGTTARSNIVLGVVGMDNACTGGCTYSFNLCPSAGLCPSGQTNGITATPVFTGGTAGSCTGFATTGSAYKLTVGSPGHNAGHDGTDVGTLYYGPYGP